MVGSLLLSLNSMFAAKGQASYAIVWLPESLPRLIGNGAVDRIASRVSRHNRLRCWRDGKRKIVGGLPGTGDPYALRAAEGVVI